MTRNTVSNKLSVLLVFAVGVGLMAGCAAKKLPAWGSPETGVILSYRMAEDDGLKYRSVFDQTQEMEVMGQKVATTTTKATEFSVASRGSENEQLDLQVTIDALEMTVGSPMGDMSPDMSGLLGKSFRMPLSARGDEGEVEVDEPLEFDMGPAGKRDATSEFKAFFPDLSAEPLQVGDTWDSSETITEEGGGVSATIRFDSVNTLDGFETVDGMECARVKSAVTGSVAGEGEQQGMKMNIEGTLEGTDTWYFAYELGRYVKSSVDITMTGEVKMAGPQTMSIPMTQKMKIEIALIP